MAIVNTHYGYCGRSKAPKFTYTGTYNVREDGVVELLTSGNLVFLNPAVIDIFCVGGGSAGATGASPGTGVGGGAGGKTATKRAISVTGTYVITIGAGGNVAATDIAQIRGGTTSFGDLVSAEGGGATQRNDATGRNGGSGGGGGTTSVSTGGSGGSDGSNGMAGTHAGGNGQGTTTREFGETEGKLYAGGGGGGRYLSAATPSVAMGGAGGGGTGGWISSSSYNYASQAAAAGAANTGGGGGGGARSPGAQPHTVQGASGGSGIVCFRKAK